MHLLQCIELQSVHHLFNVLNRHRISEHYYNLFYDNLKPFQNPSRIPIKSISFRIKKNQISKYEYAKIFQLFSPMSFGPEVLGGNVFKYYYLSSKKKKKPSTLDFHTGPPIFLVHSPNHEEINICLGSEKSEHLP